MAILDLELVLGADFSGCKTIGQMREECKERGCALVLCNGTRKLYQQLERSDERLGLQLPMLGSLAAAIYWCEEQMVQLAATGCLNEALRELGAPATAAKQLGLQFVQQSVRAGQLIWQQGDRPLALFVERGQLQQLKSEEEREEDTTRMVDGLTILPGNVVGLETLALGDQVQVTHSTGSTQYW